MPKSFIAALALIACSIAGTAFAQSSDYSDGAGGGEAPTLIMPGLVTSPITSGLDSDGARWISGAAAWSSGGSAT